MIFKNNRRGIWEAVAPVVCQPYCSAKYTSALDCVIAAASSTVLSPAKNFAASSIIFIKSGCFPIAPAADSSVKKRQSCFVFSSLKVL